MVLLKCLEEEKGPIMPITNNHPINKSLKNGLTLRNASSMNDLEAVMLLHNEVHDENVGGLIQKLFTSHPALTGEDLLLISDGNGKAVASLCLIPWSIRYGRVNLPVGELGIVSTLEPYRKQGLNRILMESFWERFQERGCLISIIQGILNFYRQYGYEYAMMPLVGGFRIQPDQVPNTPTKEYQFRPATIEDIPTLMDLRNQEKGYLGISSIRDAATWKYMLTPAELPAEMEGDTIVIADKNGSSLGYFRSPHVHFYPNLYTVDEVSEMPFDASLAMIQYVAAMAIQVGKDGIRLQIPANSGVAKLARSFAAAEMDPYSWQVRIPDLPAFLKAITPELEDRLANSMFDGITLDANLDFYKKSITLRIRSGKIEVVHPADEDAITLLAMPESQFIQLVMGGRSMEEIEHAIPDAYANDPWKLLADTLFPKTASFLGVNY